MILAGLFVVIAWLLGMVILVKAIHGTDHWVLSTQDRDDGMIIWLRRSGSDQPTYTIIVQGYRLGRNIAPLVIDHEGPSLPQDITRTFEDTTVLPGRCTLRMGPLTLDAMPAGLTVNGQDCEPGGEITVQVIALP